jgi:hypothetical protein
LKSGTRHRCRGRELPGLPCPAPSPHSVSHALRGLLLQSFGSLVSCDRHLGFPALNRKDCWINPTNHIYGTAYSFTKPKFQEDSIKLLQAQTPAWQTANNGEPKLKSASTTGSEEDPIYTEATKCVSTKILSPEGQKILAEPDQCPKPTTSTCLRAGRNQRQKQEPGKTLPKKMNQPKLKQFKERRQMALSSHTLKSKTQKLTSQASSKGRYIAKLLRRGVPQVHQWRQIA